MEVARTKRDSVLRGEAAAPAAGLGTGGADVGSPGLAGPSSQQPGAAPPLAAPAAPAADPVRSIAERIDTGMEVPTAEIDALTPEQKAQLRAWAGGGR